MKKSLLIALTAAFLAGGCGQSRDKATLKDAFKDKFLIGTALNSRQIMGSDEKGVALIREQFNAVVAENCMKSMYLQPEEGKFFFDEADKLADFAAQNGMVLTGHALVWHQQAPAWFFVDEKGNDVSREVLIARMKNHITTVVSRYKGKIKGWDVVNEAILDDGSWRESKFYTIIGKDFVRLAFEFAHAADPDAELYYNDYSMAHEAKCAAVCSMVKELQGAGVRVDGIGMQGHMMMHFPSAADFEKSLLAFSNLGVKVMITELDLSVLPTPRPNAGADLNTSFDYQKEMNPYVDGLPKELEQAQHSRYLDFFKLFVKHSDKISRVTLWGVTDGDSWRNDWPMPGRTDYALLFDRSHQPKPVVSEIISLAKK